MPMNDEELRQRYRDEGWGQLAEKDGLDPLNVEGQARQAYGSAWGEIQRLRDLLCLADMAIMRAHGRFPLDRTTPSEVEFADMCLAVRAETGKVYANRLYASLRAMERYYDGINDENL